MSWLGSNRNTISLSAFSHFLLACCSATLLISVSTIEGSARVDVSPSWSLSPQTIFRKIRRMILPDLVMGRLCVQQMMSGVAKLPMEVRTAVFNSFKSSGVSSWFCTSIQKHAIDWPLISCGAPTTAACATAEWATRALSISAVPVVGWLARNGGISKRQEKMEAVRTIGEMKERSGQLRYSAFDPLGIENKHSF